MALDRTPPPARQNDAGPAVEPSRKQAALRDRLARVLACGEAGNRGWQVADCPERREAAVLVHFPTEQPLRVGVERVQIAPIAAHGLIADSRLALDRRRGNGMEQFDATIACDRVGRDGAVAEVRDEGVAVVRADGGPADLAASVADRPADQRQPRWPESAYDDAEAAPTLPPAASVTIRTPARVKSNPYGVAPDEGNTVGPSTEPSWSTA